MERAQRQFDPKLIFGIQPEVQVQLHDHSTRQATSEFTLINDLSSSFSILDMTYNIAKRLPTKIAPSDSLSAAILPAFCNSSCPCGISATPTDGCMALSVNCSGGHSRLSLTEGWHKKENCVCVPVGYLLKPTPCERRFGIR